MISHGEGMYPYASMCVSGGVGCVFCELVGLEDFLASFTQVVPKLLERNSNYLMDAVPSWWIKTSKNDSRVIS